MLRKHLRSLSGSSLDHAPCPIPSNDIEESVRTSGTDTRNFDYAQSLPPPATFEDVDVEGRGCSIRTCSTVVPEGSTDKMCEACREGLILYSSMKKTQRKIERTLIAGMIVTTSPSSEVDSEAGTSTMEADTAVKTHLLNGDEANISVTGSLDSHKPLASCQPDISMDSPTSRSQPEWYGANGHVLEQSDPTLENIGRWQPSYANIFGQNSIPSQSLSLSSEFADSCPQTAMTLHCHTSHTNSSSLANALVMPTKTPLQDATPFVNQNLPATAPAALKSATNPHSCGTYEPTSAFPNRADVQVANENFDVGQRSLTATSGVVPNTPKRTPLTSNEGTNASMVPVIEEPMRSCSVRGCKSMVPASYEFKMCTPCRVRHQRYGDTKRAKWKAARDALHEYTTMTHEDGRSGEGGSFLPPNLCDDQTNPTATLSQTRTPTFPSSSIQGFLSASTPSNPALTELIPTPQTTMSSFAMGGPSTFASTIHPHMSNPVHHGGYAPVDLTNSPTTSLHSAFTPCSPPVSALAPPIPTVAPSALIPAPPQRVCDISHCHAILTPECQFQRCDVHREQDRLNARKKTVRDRLEKQKLMEEATTSRTDDMQAIQGEPSPRQGLSPTLRNQDDPTPSLLGIESVAPTRKRKRYDGPRRSGCEECENVPQKEYRWRTCQECRVRRLLVKRKEREVLKSKNGSGGSSDVENEKKSKKERKGPTQGPAGVENGQDESTIENNSQSSLNPRLPPEVAKAVSPAHSSGFVRHPVYASQHPNATSANSFTVPPCPPPWNYPGIQPWNGVIPPPVVAHGNEMHSTSSPSADGLTKSCLLTDDGKQRQQGSVQENGGEMLSRTDGDPKRAHKNDFSDAGQDIDEGTGSAGQGDNVDEVDEVQTDSREVAFAPDSQMKVPMQPTISGDGARLLSSATLPPFAPTHGSSYPYLPYYSPYAPYPYSFPSHPPAWNPTAASTSTSVSTKHTSKGKKRLEAPPSFQPSASSSANSYPPPGYGYRYGYPPPHSTYPILYLLPPNGEPVYYVYAYPPPGSSCSTQPPTPTFLPPHPPQAGFTSSGVPPSLSNLSTSIATEIASTSQHCSRIETDFPSISQGTAPTKSSSRNVGRAKTPVVGKNQGAERKEKGRRDSSACKHGRTSQTDNPDIDAAQESTKAKEGASTQRSNDSGELQFIFHYADSGQTRSEQPRKKRLTIDPNWKQKWVMYQNQGQNIQTAAEELTSTGSSTSSGSIQTANSATAPISIASSSATQGDKNKTEEYDKPYCKSNSCRRPLSSYSASRICDKCRLRIKKKRDNMMTRLKLVPRLTTVGKQRKRKT